MEEKEQDTFVDVAAIVEEIRAQVAADIESGKMPKFEDIPYQGPVCAPMLGEEFVGVFAQQSEGCRVAYFRDTGGGIKGKLRRLIRKAVKPVVLPVVEDQNAQNECVLMTMQALAKVVQKQEERIAALEKALAAVQEKDR